MGICEYECVACEHAELSWLTQAKSVSWLLASCQSQPRADHERNAHLPLSIATVIQPSSRHCNCDSTMQQQLAKHLLPNYSGTCLCLVLTVMNIREIQ